MHGFVTDNFFEHDRWRVPVDRAQLQETAIEPGMEQVLKVGIDLGKHGIFAQQFEHVFAHVQQAGGAAGREIEPAQHFLAAGLGCYMQLPGGSRAGVRGVMADRGLKARAID